MDSDNDLKEYLTPAQILSYLYLGAKRQIYGKPFEELKFTHVLNVCSSASYPNNPPYSFHHIPISDSGDDDLLTSDILQKCFSTIDLAKNGGRIFLHCKEGINRSATVVLAYLISREGWTFNKAFNHVSTLSPRISPHENYFKQLQDIEEQKHGKITLTRKDVGPSIQEQIREIQRSFLYKNNNNSV